MDGTSGAAWEAGPSSALAYASEALSSPAHPLPVAPAWFTLAPGEATVFALRRVVLGSVPLPRFRVPKPVGTPRPRGAETVAVFTAVAGTPAGDWQLKLPLIVEARPARREWMATTWLEGVQEYGHGADLAHAFADLLSSIGEYLTSLEAHEPALGEQAIRELAYLRRLLGPADRT